MPSNSQKWWRLTQKCLNLNAKERPTAAEVVRIIHDIKNGVIAGTHIHQSEIEKL
jgi:hypothetical protein